MALLGVAAVLLLVAGTDGAVKEEQHGFAIWTATAGGTDGEGACGYGGHPAETIPFNGLVAGLGADHGDCGVCYRVSTALHVPSFLPRSVHIIALPRAVRFHQI